MSEFEVGDIVIYARDLYLIYKIDLCRSEWPIRVIRLRDSYEDGFHKNMTKFNIYAKKSLMTQMIANLYG